MSLPTTPPAIMDAITAEVSGLDHATGQALIRDLALAAATDLPVLISTDEASLAVDVAQLIHRHSERRDAPFATVTASGVVEFLTDRLGGTVLIPELTDLAPSTQSALVTELDCREACARDDRLPGDASRIISATRRLRGHRTPLPGVSDELYYRLNVICVHIPMGFSSADGPYTDGTGMSLSRR